MNYDAFFADAVARLHDERRYRVFADLERVAGRFPHAIWHAPHGIQPINYPTVPKGTERLRITPSPYHDDGSIEAARGGMNPIPLFSPRSQRAGDPAHRKADPRAAARQLDLHVGWQANKIETATADLLSSTGRGSRRQRLAC